MRRPAWRRRWFDPLAMLVIGCMVVGAGLLPTLTANSGETVTIRGEVVLDGGPLAFFPVGFWVPGDAAADGVLNTTQTDASGRFTLEVPSGRDGFAFAGAAPDSDRAVVTSGDRQVVRGVIGSKAASPISSPLYQGWTPATGRGLAQGRQVRFVLQRPGRLAGTSPVPASALTSLQVRRFDGSVVQTLRPGAKGRFQSNALAPGTYGVTLVPKPPALPAVATAVVQPGGLTEVRLAAPVAGAVVSGTVRTVDGPVPAGVPILLERDGKLVARTTTSSSGRYTIAGVAAGPYRLEAGRLDVGLERSAASDVPIPGRTSTPTPAATPAPTPTGSLDSPQAAALAPVERTSDAVRPTAVDLEVPSALGDIDADVLVEAAGRVTGTVTAGGGGPVDVVAEDPATGRIVRSTTASASGGYALGGLTLDTEYRILAVSRPSGGAVARMGAATAIATASTTGVDLELDRPALSLIGTVAGTAAGAVTIDGAIRRTAPVQRDGSYRLDGLVPGAYPVTVSTPDRIPSQPVAAVLPADPARLDLQPGPKPAAFRAWFISGGAGVPVVRGSASTSTGAAVRFGEAVNGRVAVSGLAPGSYAFDVDGFQGTVPAVDGPWFFLPPAGTFSLSDGAETDLGPVVLHVRAR